MLLSTKKSFLFILVSFLLGGIYAQNLVPNPSFELFNTCPVSYGTLPIPNWQKPTGHIGSADYFNTCAGASANLGVPTNTFGTQTPATGNAYCGLCTYHYSGNFREYIQAQLTQPLVAGKCYDVCLKWSTAEIYPKYSSDNLGIYLSNTAITAPSGPINVVPQLLTPKGVMLENKNGWTQFCGTYIAVGGERWITIGNFYNDANTVLNITYNTPGSFGAAYYFIDDVSVNEIPCSGSNSYGDTICKGDQALIYAMGGTTYNWYQLGSPSSSLGTNDSILVSPSVTTQYVVTIDGVNDTVTVIVNPTYSVNATASICQGDSILIGGVYQSVAGVYNDTLSTIKGCDSIIITTLTIKPNASSTINAVLCNGSSYNFNGTNLTTAGTYKDTIPSANGCDSIITLNLTVNSSASSISASICTGASYFFNGTNLTTSGIYKDTILNSLGCDSIITLTLSVSSVVTFNYNHSICAGASYFFNGTNLTASGTYKDTLNSVNGCDSIVTLTLIVHPTTTSNISHSMCAGSSYLFNGTNLTASGTYKDTLSNVNGCDSIITLTLIVNSLPVAGVSPDTTIDQGTTTTLTATGGGTYNWFPSTGLNSSSGSSVNASPLVTTTYCVEVTNTNGCKDTACVTVTVEPVEIVPCVNSNTNYTIPNAFSPNGDGVNDEYCLQGWDECVDIFTITIFDRWGEKVFESTDPKFCWNGTYRGQSLDPAVFVYSIKATYTDSNKTIRKTGNISLIK